MIKENLILTIISLAVIIFLWKSVDILYNKFFKEKKQIHLKFFKNFFQAAIVIIGLYNLGMHFESFKTFSESLLTSSSLLVVVLGFAFQTSLEDFIAGILISIFKPFNIDDRITLQGLNISGYIENITIRHTIIRTFTNNRLIIPNSIMNKEVIENTHIVDPESSNFMDVMITYESNVSLAKKIMADVICSHPSVIDTRTEEQKKQGVPQIKVFIRDLADSGICLRANVTTRDIDDNFAACSDIRESLLEEFEKNGIDFAYPTQRILSEVEIKK